MAVAWLTDPPNRFSPRSEWETFLKEYETHPGKDDPDVKRTVAKVQGYLDEADRREAASAKKKTR